MLAGLGLHVVVVLTSVRTPRPALVLIVGTEHHSRMIVLRPLSIVTAPLMHSSTSTTLSLCTGSSWFTCTTLSPNSSSYYSCPPYCRVTQHVSFFFFNDPPPPEIYPLPLPAPFPIYKQRMMGGDEQGVSPRHPFLAGWQTGCFRLPHKTPARRAPTADDRRNARIYGLREPAGIGHE